jgi:hypothetical protein
LEFQLSTAPLYILLTRPYGRSDPVEAVVTITEFINEEGFVNDRDHPLVVGLKPFTTWVRYLIVQGFLFDDKNEKERALFAVETLICRFLMDTLKSTSCQEDSSSGTLTYTHDDTKTEVTIMTNCTVSQLNEYLSAVENLIEIIYGGHGNIVGSWVLRDGETVNLNDIFMMSATNMKFTGAQCTNWRIYSSCCQAQYGWSTGSYQNGIQVISGDDSGLSLWRNMLKGNNHQALLGFITQVTKKLEHDPEMKTVFEGCWDLLFHNKLSIDSSEKKENYDVKQWMICSMKNNNDMQSILQPPPLQLANEAEMFKNVDKLLAKT